MLPFICKNQVYTTISRVLYHFVQFGGPLSQLRWFGRNLLPVPYVADIKMWFEKRVKNGKFSKILTLKDHSRLNRRQSPLHIYY